MNCDFNYFLYVIFTDLHNQMFLKKNNILKEKKSEIYYNLMLISFQQTPYNINI